MKRLFTSESVTEGHPDKVCDFIADSVLDEALSQDPNCRIACEVCASAGLVAVLGEFTTTGYVDIQRVARNAIAQVGYNRPEYGFDAKTCAVLTSIDEQSPDISVGVTKSIECREADSNDVFDSEGAGDQGMMFGYATDESTDFMPMPLYLSHKLTKRLSEVRKNNALPYLRPDGKAQVTLVYENNIPQYVDTVVVSAQHDEDAALKKLRADIEETVIRTAIPKKLLRPDTKIYINPTGRFVTGGPKGDTGVTGRKIIVDSYGGAVPHGGGAYSGKDPSKVDRSASYYARYVCKNIVAAGLCKRCMLTVSYAIGKARPVSVDIETFGTATVAEEKLFAAVNAVFDFRPYAIIKSLNLKTPIYKKTTNYGHFGDKDVPYEKTDKVNALLEAVK